MCRTRRLCTLSVAGLSAVILCHGGPAFAQSPDRPLPRIEEGDVEHQEDTSPAVAAQPAPAETAPRARANLWEGLQSAGVAPRLVFINQSLANPSAGMEPGNVSNTGVLSLGVDLDLERIAGIGGARIHVLESVMLLEHNLAMPQQIGGAIAGLQYITVPIKNHLSVLTFEQRFADDRLVVEAGRSNMQRYFVIPNCENATSCQSPIISFVAGVPPPRFANWMVRANYNITPATYVQAGVFEQRFANVRTKGFHFDLNGGTGALFLAELGHKTDFSTSTHPGRYELGAYYNSSDHNDPYYTIENTPIPRNRTTPPLTHPDNGGLFFFGQQVIWRENGAAGGASNPKRITLYGQYLHDFSKSVPYSDEAAIGVSVTGLIPGAPRDSFGLKAKMLRMTQRQFRLQDTARVVSGGPPGRTHRLQYDLEANAHFQISSFLAWEVTAQYLLHPDAFFNPYRAAVPQSGWFVGSHVIIDFGRLFSEL